MLDDLDPVAGHIARDHVDDVVGSLLLRHLLHGLRPITDHRDVLADLVGRPCLVCQSRQAHERRHECVVLHSRLGRQDPRRRERHPDSGAELGSVLEVIRAARDHSFFTRNQSQPVRLSPPRRRASTHQAAATAASTWPAPTHVASRPRPSSH